MLRNSTLTEISSRSQSKNGFKKWINISLPEIIKKKNILRFEDELPRKSLSEPNIILKKLLNTLSLSLPFLLSPSLLFVFSGLVFNFSADSLALVRDFGHSLKHVGHDLRVEFELVPPPLLRRELLSCSQSQKLSQ